MIFILYVIILSAWLYLLCEKFKVTCATELLATRPHLKRKHNLTRLLFANLHTGIWLSCHFFVRHRRRLLALWSYLLLLEATTRSVIRFIFHLYDHSISLIMNFLILKQHNNILAQVEFHIILKTLHILLEKHFTAYIFVWKFDISPTSVPLTW